MKNCIIIGNAKIEILNSESKIFLEKLIKESDVIIRFNNLLNYGNEFGVKTSYLFCTNKGNPGMRYPSFKLFIKLLFNKPKSIIYSYPKEFYSHSPFVVKILGKDYSDFISRKLFFIKNKNFIENSIYSESLKMVNYESSKFVPSSGLIALNFILKNFDSKIFKIYFIGFSWQGWDGHNWAFEKNYFKSLVQDGKIEEIKL